MSKDKVIQKLSNYFKSASGWPVSWSVPNWQMHRGYHKNCIENSKSALAAAAAAGEKMCEFDVRLTKDRVPVLFHDKDLNRNFSKNLLLENLNFKEIHDLQLPISTLEEVLLSDDITNFLNIEIKSEAIFNDPIERKISEKILKYYIRCMDKALEPKKILFSSFNPFSLWKMQSYLPQVPRALLVSLSVESSILRKMLFAPMLELQGIHFDHQMLSSPEDIYFWQRRGYYVAAWTVNNANRAQELKSWGVDSIISDELSSLS